MELNGPEDGYGEGFSPSNPPPLGYGLRIPGGQQHVAHHHRRRHHPAAPAPTPATIAGMPQWLVLVGLIALAAWAYHHYYGKPPRRSSSRALEDGDDA